MKRRVASAGFSLVEMMISIATSVAVLGALFLASMSIQRMLHGSELYADNYSNQRRIIDYVGRELRRAIAISATDASGTRHAVSDETVNIADRATLILTLPGYYQSNVPADGSYGKALDVVAGDQRPEYGNSNGPAQPVEVTFRKVYVASEKGVCFVREEGSAGEVVVRQADNLFVQLSITGGGQRGLVQAWFRAPFTSTPMVSTYDQFMLRNAPAQALP